MASQDSGSDTDESIVYYPLPPPSPDLLSSFLPSSTQFIVPPLPLIPIDTTMSSVSAAQRVFSTPELVAIIIGWIAKIRPIFPFRVEGPFHPSARGTLASCSRINSLWFCEAQRHLWQLPKKLNAASFSHIAPARRQIYANFVKHIFLLCEPKHHGWLSRQKKLLRNVTFPNARSANLQIYSYLRNPLVAPFYAPAMENLYIWVRKYADKYVEVTLEPRASRKLAWSLKKMFPGLKTIHFSEDSSFGGGVVEIFQQEFQGVDVSILDEGLGYL